MNTGEKVGKILNRNYQTFPAKSSLKSKLDPDNTVGFIPLISAI